MSRQLEVEDHIRTAIKSLGEATMLMSQDYERFGLDNRLANSVIGGIMSILENIKVRIYQHKET